MLVGISTYTYPWAFGIPGYPPSQPMTGLDLLREAGRLGVQAVQFGDNYPLHRLAPVDWQTLRAEARNRHLQVQVGTRGLTPDNLRTYIKLAWEAQSPFLRMVIDDGAYQPDIPQIIDIIRAKLPVLESAGVVLALENHDRFTGEDLWRIATETSLQWVGFCLDTTNSFGAGETAEQVLNSLTNANLVNLHVKDFRVERVAHKMGFTIEGCEPGAGMLDLNYFLFRLRDDYEQGKDGSMVVSKRKKPLAVTLEQWPPFLDTLDQTIVREAQWAETGVDWIKNTLNQLS